ncbi:MAG: class I SAM-dependent methyltransferase [Pseudomonadota bacterium]
MNQAVLDPGSFRDPGGHVFHHGNRVYRTVNPAVAEDFDKVEASGLIEELVARGWCLAATKVDRDLLGSTSDQPTYLLEHPKIELISYPYEWPFRALKAAALLHLDIQLLALQYDVALSDASAYNIQFQGAKPVFIDRLSFVPYRDGDIWAGHRQFCEQFLNPLLLRSVLGVPHNAWYRGAQEGITTQDLNRMIPLRRKLSWQVFAHVLLQAKFQASAQQADSKSSAPEARKVGLPRASLTGMLTKLRQWIAKLEPRGADKTVWADYATSHSYQTAESEAKARLIADYAADVKPHMIWDLGCNTGDYSKIALEAGAETAIGFDFDQDALDGAFLRSEAENLNLLPLFLDAANPTSGQGWGASERMGLAERATADGVLALAFVHHLAITRNIPLRSLVSWIVGLAPTGVIEFVPKQDAMVQKLLSLRKDIFTDYTEDAFANYLSEVADIVSATQVTESGRKLFRFARTGS